MISKWDIRFLDLARRVAAWSKDPSTQVGAIISDQHNRIISLGYNGFPRGVKDRPEWYRDRNIKYKMIVHAEKNAILFAERSVEQCTLYTHPFPPCSQCTGMLIQKGIGRIVAPMPSDEIIARWGEDLEIALQMAKDAEIVTEFPTQDEIKRLHLEE